MQKRSKIAFVKNNFQIAYSLLLIFFIPAAIAVNTILFTQSFKDNFDQVLYDKTISVGNVVNVVVQENLNNPIALQEEVNKIAKANKDIDLLRIIMPIEGTFYVISSLNSDDIGKQAQDIENLVAWQQKTPVAYLASSQKTGERFWVVIMPLADEKEKVTSLLSMRVSLKGMDTRTHKTLNNSYVILAVTILIIVLLVANNARFFEYATLYRKLQEVDEMKDEFISMASHELRTPVTAIRGFISLVLEGTYGKIKPEMREVLELAFNSASRLNLLVEDLLNVSRIEQGRLQVALEPTDPTDVIISTIKELKVQADEKRISLEFIQPLQPLPTVHLDKDKFKQVMINIIGNAIKYTQKGKVEISTHVLKGDKKLAIVTKDTGIGMSQEERARLFEKFYRVKTKETQDITGTGLGLWITKQIIEMMHGTITIDSMKGVGTQLTITFSTDT